MPIIKITVAYQQPVGKVPSLKPVET